MKIPLEDSFSDVIGKAMRGYGLNPTGLGRLTGLNPLSIEAVLDGKFDSGVVARLATPLNLHGPSLFELATRAWYPEQVQVDGLEVFNTACPVNGIPDMTVNSYLVWDPTTRYAAVFDAGGSVAAVAAAIAARKLRVCMICLTHNHDDHVRALGPLLEATGNPPVWTNPLERVPGAQPIEKDTNLSIGYLQVEICRTSGHSLGGTTYVVSGLRVSVAIVGDALFCCSQGGANASHYKEALQNNRSQIFSLPDETVLCPGHGPASTVREEKDHNPFYPEYKETPGH